MRLRIVPVLALVIAASSPAAADRSSDALEAEIRVRQAEIEAEAAVLASLGERHPLRQQMQRRLVAVQAAVLALPPIRPEVTALVLAGLRRIGVSLLLRKAALSVDHGEAHPAVREIDRRVEVIRRHLLAHGSSLAPTATDPPRTFTQLIIDRAEADALLAHHERLGRGDRHPAVVAARERLVAIEADQRLQGEAPVDRALVRDRFLQALVLHRARREGMARANPEDANVIEEDAVIDGLVVAAARFCEAAPPAPPAAPVHRRR